MRRATGILVGITWLASATHLQAAQFEEPPTITVLVPERKVRASVGADASPEVDETLSTMAGPFASSAFMQRSRR